MDPGLPAADVGLFGPGSVTWRVHAHPAMLVGGMRALIIQSLHPLAMAGVAQHSDYATRGLYRLRRTVQYVLTVTYGDTTAASAAGAVVRRVHERIHGTDPVTGRDYTASDPETLLWVHSVEAHSFVTAYQRFGGVLHPEEVDSYFDEGARAAELVGIPPSLVPRSRAAMRAYFERIRPSLCVSEEAIRAIRFITRPRLTRRTAPLIVAAQAAVGLVPAHLRALAGLERPRAVDVLVEEAARRALPGLARLSGAAATEEENIARLQAMVRAQPFAARAPRPPAPVVLH